MEQGEINMAEILLNAQQLKQSDLKKYQRQAEAVNDWYIVKHSKEKHDVGITNNEVRKIVRTCRILEIRFTESGTVRVLYSDGHLGNNPAHHYVVDLTDEKFVTVYTVVTNQAKALERGSVIRGLFSGSDYTIESTGVRRSYREWQRD